MLKLPIWIPIITAFVSIVVALSGNWLTSMWQPESLTEQTLVVGVFVLSSVILFLLEYLQNSASHTTSFWRTVKRWISPWWLVAFGSLLTIFFWLTESNLTMLAGMITVFALSMISIFERIPWKRKLKSNPPLLSRPYPKYSQFKNDNEVE
ncbi:hypothetical protein HC928_09850 [bacterium]|nr:hypothetical protein [bacterium]